MGGFFQSDIGKPTCCNIDSSFHHRADTHTHTHLLRTIFATSDVECILRAKAIKSTPITPDRNGSMKRPEKFRKVTIPIASVRCKELEVDTSVSTKPNQIVPTLTDCEKFQVPLRPWQVVERPKLCCNALLPSGPW